eukprot:gene13648-15076_t
MYLALLDSHYIPDTLRGCNACIIVLLRYLEMQEKTVIMKLVDWMVKRVNNCVGFHSLFELVPKDEDVQQSIINDSENKHAEWDEDISYMTEGLQIPEEGWAEDLSYMAYELAEAVPSAHDSKVMPFHSLEDDNCTPTCTNGLVWHGILTKFGLTTFKPFQLQALWAIDHGRDAIVVQRTGSGKSLCFQVVKRNHIDAIALRNWAGDEEPQNNARVLGDRHGDRPLLAYMTQEHFNKVCQDLHGMLHYIKMLGFDEELGSAGRTDDHSSGGLLLFNESKDDQRLGYCVKGCGEPDTERIKSDYAECWQWIYCIYTGDCLSEALLQYHSEGSYKADRLFLFTKTLLL